MKTPCEELGYKVGDKFVALEHSLFPEGTILTLHRDDGTSIPLFAGEGSDFNNCLDAEGNRQPGAFYGLSYVKPYKGETE